MNSVDDAAFGFSAVEQCLSLFSVARMGNEYAAEWFQIIQKIAPLKVANERKRRGRGSRRRAISSWRKHIIWAHLVVRPTMSGLRNGDYHEVKASLIRQIRRKKEVGGKDDT